MADPFFRGMNAMDWVFAIAFHAAYDWSSVDLASQFADQFNLIETTEYATPGNFLPACLVAVCDDYVFVLVKSTHPVQQWFGNILGSGATEVPPAGGQVSQFFGLAALTRWLQMSSYVVSQCQTRKLVIIGFSLGGAVATILSDMFKKHDGLASSVIAFGSPRAGTDTFVAGFDNSNYAHVAVDGDPVPSVPPEQWSAAGFHNYWTAESPFVTYSHPTAQFTLQAPDTITPGETFLSLSDLIYQFDVQSWLLFHDQAVYAPILRRGLPDTLDDGFEGFPKASAFDCLALQAFFYSSRGWPWCQSTTASKLQEGSGMAVQLVIGIRDNSGIPLGFKEVYYLQGTDPSVAQSSISSRASSFLATRAKFLSNKCEIYYARCSAVNMGVPFSRKSYLYKYTDNPIQGTEAGHADIDDAVAFDGWTTDRTVRRSFHFRGIAETWLLGDKLSTIGVPKCAPNGPVFAWLQQLQNLNLVALSGKGSSTTGTIDSAAQTAQNMPIVLTCNPGFPGVSLSSQLVEIRGCRQAPLLNGRWVATSQALGTNVLLLQGSQRLSAPASISGTIRLVQNVDSGLLKVFQFSDVTSKKTGKPDFLQRGRRSVQLRHR